MGVGHIAVAVVLKKADPKVNLGFLVFAAMFADFLLGILVLLGVETVHIPEAFKDLHYLTFTFPFSHGLVSSLLWAVLFFLLGWGLYKKETIAGLVAAAAVLSHFVLDWIVHIPELPVLGNGSPLLGLGLWNYMTLALGLETALVLAAFVIYGWFTPGVTGEKRLWVSIVLGVVTVITVAGKVLSPQAPQPQAAAWSWVIETVITSLLFYWIDRPGRPKTARTQNSPASTIALPQNPGKINYRRYPCAVPS